MFTKSSSLLWNFFENYAKIVKEVCKESESNFEQVDMPKFLFYNFDVQVFEIK